MQDFFQEEEEEEEKEEKGKSLKDEKMKKKKKMKPLLRKLSEVSPPCINWVGTSYGMTRELFQFWKKNEFSPVYLKQSRNDLTAEHNVIMLKAVHTQETQVNHHWLLSFT